MINTQMRLPNCSGPVDCMNDINKLRIRPLELVRVTEFTNYAFVRLSSEEPHVLRSLAPSISLQSGRLQGLSAGALHRILRPISRTPFNYRNQHDDTRCIPNTT
jgi:hypothetical protein